MKKRFDVAATRQSAALLPKTSHRRFPKRRYAGVAALALWLLTSALCLPASAQYSIDWFTIDGGGGTSSGGVYSVSGTIGQLDAGTMSGGNYTLDGGFWGIIAAVQSPGAPLLTITRSGNSVIVSWPSPSTGWTLQTNGTLSTGIWVNYGGTINNNTVTNSPPTGNLFFRLTHP